MANITEQIANSDEIRIICDDLPDVVITASTVLAYIAQGNSVAGAEIWSAQILADALGLGISQVEVDLNPDGTPYNVTFSGMG